MCQVHGVQKKESNKGDITTHMMVPAARASHGSVRNWHGCEGAVIILVWSLWCQAFNDVFAIGTVVKMLSSFFSEIQPLLPVSRFTDCGFV